MLNLPLSITATFAFLNIAAAIPVEATVAVPFQGTGQLIALQYGKEIGCLTPILNVTVDFNQCATFTSALWPGKEEDWRRINISSSAGECGYKYVGFDPQGAENGKYKIECGAEQKITWDGLRAAAGRYAHKDWKVVTAFGHRNFTTNDFVTRSPALPTGSDSRNVFTDEWMYKDYDFQVGWKAFTPVSTRNVF